jgi:hypothetical protein
MWLYIIILIFFIIIIYFYFFNKIKYYDFNTNSKIKICFIAGVHGNEPAGSITLNELIKEKYFENKNIFIRIIPIVNKFGYNFNIRYQNNPFYPDINRNFSENGPVEKNSKELYNLTKDMDIVIDFHEGWGFYKINPESVGSTITVTPKLKYLGQKIINNINKNIVNLDYKFILRNDICEINTTLGCYLNNKNKNYILVETTGQNNIQPLYLRKNQIKNIIQTIINNYI